jgi:hypothetical protein
MGLGQLGGRFGCASAPQGPSKNWIGFRHDLDAMEPIDRGFRIAQGDVAFSGAGMGEGSHLISLELRKP